MDFPKPRRSALTRHALTMTKNPDVFQLEDLTDSTYQSEDSDAEDAPSEAGGDVEAGPLQEADSIYGTRPQCRIGLDNLPKWRRQAPEVVKTPNIPAGSLQYWHEEMASAKEIYTIPAFTVADWEAAMTEWRLTGASTRSGILEQVDRHMTEAGGLLGRPIDVHLVRESSPAPEDRVEASETYKLLLDCNIPILVEQAQNTWLIEDAARTWSETGGPTSMNHYSELQVLDSGAERSNQVAEGNEDGRTGESGGAHEQRLMSPRRSTLREIFDVFITREGRPHCPLNYDGLKNDFCDWDIPRSIRRQSLKEVLFRQDPRNSGSTWTPKQFCNLTMGGAYTLPRRSCIGYLTCVAVIGGEDGGRRSWEFPAGDKTDAASSLALMGSGGISPQQEWATIELSSGECVLIIPPNQIYGVRTLTDSLTVGYQDWTASTFHLSLDSIREEFFTGDRPEEEASVDEWLELLDVVGLFDDGEVFTHENRTKIANSGRKLVKAYMRQKGVGESHMRRHANKLQIPTAKTLVMKIWAWLKSLEED